MTVNVFALPFKSIVPVFMGPTLRVALLLSVKLPALTSVLLIVPWNKIAPVLVITPLKNASAVIATVAALLRPPLKLAPAPLFVSTPVPLTTSRVFVKVVPFRSNVPAVMNVVPLVMELT